LNAISLDTPDREITGSERIHQSCCSAALAHRPTYRCPNGGHVTCRPHLYMDARWRPHCYTCMAELSDFTPDAPLIYERRRATAESSRTAVIVIHALHMCGAARHCLELAQQFHHRGFMVTILSIGGGGHWAHRFLDVADTLIIGSPSDTWPTFIHHLMDADVAFITAHHDPAISWTLDNAPSTIPVYAHFHIEPSSGRATAELLTAAARRCINVFFPSNRTLEQYRTLISQGTHCNLAVLENSVPHGITPQPVRPSRVPYVQRRLGSRRPTSSHLAVISRLDSDKFSIPLFVSALQLVTSKVPRVNITVAGSGEMAADIQSAAQEADLSPFLNFVGFVDDIGRLYQSADAVFVPSHTEAMPYTALESAATGTPCVIPRLGYFADEATAMAHVHVFDPGDYAGAASLIIDALTAPRRRKRHSAPQPRASATWSETVLAAYSLEPR
jgi:glycosyltransferase involved in cell wall biosynthesis